jgi:mRNA interferase RelE/StbE
MSRYRLDYTARAAKDLEKLERQDAQRVVRALEGIRDDPRGHVEKLKTSVAASPIYSLHAGRFRVLLQLLDDRLLVLVLEVRQRKTAYRDF